MTFEGGWSEETKTLCIKPQGFMAECRNLSEPMPAADQENFTRDLAQKKTASRASNLSSIKAGLKVGFLVEFGCTGGWGFIHDPRTSVNEIMHMPGLSREQRIELLKQRVFRHYDSALDVLDNYDEAEWALTSEK
jgi:hypothetical protein